MMNRMQFAAWCRSGVRLLDGATGTNLLRAGMPKGACTEQWVLEHPETLEALQRQYAAAGSEAVYAPTFCANRAALARHGLSARVHQMNCALVQLSRRAVGPDVLVAGDMTTLGFPMEEDGPHSRAELVKVYREQAEALADGGVDFFAVETMMGLGETLAALEAIRSVSDLPVLCTLSFRPNGKAYFDGDAAEAASLLQEMGADAVGVNCSSGPEQLEDVVRTMKAACTLPIAAKPNAGLPTVLENGEAVYSMRPEAFAAAVAQLTGAGASLVGGCCGTTPEHIAALRALVKK